MTHSTKENESCILKRINRLPFVSLASSSMCTSLGVVVFKILCVVHGHRTCQFLASYVRMVWLGSWILGGGGVPRCPSAPVRRACLLCQPTPCFSFLLQSLRCATEPPYPCSRRSHTPAQAPRRTPFGPTLHRTVPKCNTPSVRTIS